MICNCGNETTDSTHTVKTLEKANEWGKGRIVPSQLPVKVSQDKCGACGRLHVMVYDNQNRPVIAWG